LEVKISRSAEIDKRVLTLANIFLANLKSLKMDQTQELFRVLFIDRKEAKFTTLTIKIQEFFISLSISTLKFIIRPRLRGY
jgi:hypothetical protein